MPSYHTTTETETEVSATSQVLVRGGIFGKRYGKVGCKRRRFNKYLRVTSAHSACDMLLPEYLFGEIDEWNFMVSPYDSWRLYEGKRIDSSKSFNITVPTGYYYRLCGYHAAKESTKEYFIVNKWKIR